MDEKRRKNYQVNAIFKNKYIRTIKKGVKMS